VFTLPNLSFALSTHDNNSLDITCEPEIETSQHIVMPPGEWQVSKISKSELKPAESLSKHTLSAISFSDGPPSNMAILAPERTTILKSNKQKFVSTWHFNDKQTIHYICSYWDTAIQLAKPLPKHAMTCYLEGARNGGAVTAWCELNKPASNLETEAVESGKTTAVESLAVETIADVSKATESNTRISDDNTTSPTETPSEEVSLSPIITPTSEDTVAAPLIDIPTAESLVNNAKDDTEATQNQTESTVAIDEASAETIEKEVEAIEAPSSQPTDLEFEAIQHENIGDLSLKNNFSETNNAESAKNIDENTQNMTQNEASNDENLADLYQKTDEIEAKDTAE